MARPDTAYPFPLPRKIETIEQCVEGRFFDVKVSLEIVQDTNTNKITVSGFGWQLQKKKGAA